MQLVNRFVTRFLTLKSTLEGKKTYIVALVTFLASLKGAHGSVVAFLNSAQGLHAELATLVVTLRAALGRRG